MQQVKSCLFTSEEMVCGNDNDDEDDNNDDDQDSDSDNEDDDEEGNNNNTDDKTKKQDDEEEGFFTRVFEALVDKLKVLKTRSGRAGLVHNFLRGLQVLSAPVPSGLSTTRVI